MRRAGDGKLGGGGGGVGLYGLGRFVVGWAAVLLTVIGCATWAAAAAPTETVGTLAPSSHSVATLPVHATTDFAQPEVIDTGDEAAGAPSAVAATARDETPDVAPKTSGLVAGAPDLAPKVDEPPVQAPRSAIDRR